MSHITNQITPVRLGRFYIASEFSVLLIYSRCLGFNRCVFLGVGGGGGLKGFCVIHPFSVSFPCICLFVGVLSYVNNFPAEYFSYFRFGEM